jgi:hypothetical protein
MYLEVNNAECINYYLDPLFDSMQSMAPFRVPTSAVVDQCTKRVERNTETNMNGPKKVNKVKDGLRHFVYENCKLFYKTNSTNWISENFFPWFNQQSFYTKSDTAANSDVLDEDDDPDFEDDGFRYFADEEDEGDDDTVRRYADTVPRWYKQNSKKRKYCSDNEDYDES